MTLIWAGVIGFCGGVSSIAFRVATSIVHKILTGSSAPGLVESFSQMPRPLRLIVPAVGGLLAGAILQFGTRLRGRVTTPTTWKLSCSVMGKSPRDARCLNVSPPFSRSLPMDRLIGTIAKTDVILALAGSTTRSATMVDSPS